jgi:hypothetical protein
MEEKQNLRIPFSLELPTKPEWRIKVLQGDKVFCEVICPDLSRAFLVKDILQAWLDQKPKETDEEGSDTSVKVQLEESNLIGEV